MLPDIQFGAHNLRDTVHRIHELARNGGAHYVCFCEANLFVKAWRQPDVAQILKQADLVCADGVSVLMMSRIRGMHVPKRVPGPVVLPALCEYGIPHGLRHFFLGGKQDVAARLVENLTARFPGLIVAGTYSPPFRQLDDADNAIILQQIETARPDVVWVGLGAPKQERWMAAQRTRVAAPVMLGVGAAFDFHAGSKLWAPLWIRKLGMEWAFRMVTGGRETLCRNLRCVTLMAAALGVAVCERLWGRRKGRGSGGEGRSERDRGAD